MAKKKKRSSKEETIPVTVRNILLKVGGAVLIIGLTLGINLHIDGEWLFFASIAVLVLMFVSLHGWHYEDVDWVKSKKIVVSGQLGASVISLIFHLHDLKWYLLFLIGAWAVIIFAYYAGRYARIRWDSRVVAEA